MDSQTYPKSYGRRKRRTQKAAFALFRILSLAVVLVLFAILGFIIVKGAGVISWDFLTKAPENGMTEGGIFPAIVGTLLLMLGSAVVSFPIGIMSGIYMNEYASRGWVVKFIRMMTNNLSGVPSIVFGLFGMALFVKYLGFGDSILAGSLTLGLLSLPLVIRTTEEALRDIPSGIREGSLALGATKLQTIWKVVLPMGMPRIITGLILSLGRVSGETAPIIFTAATSTGAAIALADVFTEATPALPWNIYNICSEHEMADKIENVQYGMVLTLIAIVLLLNSVAIVLRDRLQKKLRG